MKKMTTLLAVLMIQVTVFTQNPLFRHFGDSYSQVVDYLEERDWAKVEMGEDFISAETPGFRIFYFFHHKALYKMVLTTSFDKRKDMAVEFSHFQNHYTHLNATILETEIKNNQATAFMAVKDDLKVLVTSLQPEEESFEILVVAESDAYSPEGQASRNSKAVTLISMR